MIASVIPSGSAGPSKRDPSLGPFRSCDLGEKNNTEYLTDIGLVLYYPDYSYWAILSLKLSTQNNLCRGKVRLTWIEGAELI